VFVRINRAQLLFANDLLPARLRWARPKPQALGIGLGVGAPLVVPAVVVWQPAREKKRLPFLCFYPRRGVHIVDIPRTRPCPGFPKSTLG